MLEYAIIPVSFKNYDEHVNILNDYGLDGWVFTAVIRKYNNSPLEGYTTYDYVAHRKLLWYEALYVKLFKFIYNVFSSR